MHNARITVAMHLTLHLYRQKSPRIYHETTVEMIQRVMYILLMNKLRVEMFVKFINSFSFIVTETE